MALTRRIARPLLASVFIADGIDSIRDPERRAKAAQAVTVPLVRRVPAVPDDPELLVRLNGVVQVGAGVLLAVGRLRRLAALALIVSIVPTTYAAHRFWEEEDEELRVPSRRSTSSRTSACWAASCSPPSTPRVHLPSAGAPTAVPPASVRPWPSDERRDRARPGTRRPRWPMARSSSPSTPGTRRSRRVVTSMALQPSPRSARRNWPHVPPGRPTWPDGNSPTPCPEPAGIWLSPWEGPGAAPRIPSPASPMGGRRR